MQGLPPCPGCSGELVEMPPTMSLRTGSMGSAPTYDLVRCTNCADTFSAAAVRQGNVVNTVSDDEMSNQ